MTEVPEMGVAGVAGGVACVVTPSLAPTAVKMQQGVRRTSIRREQTPTEKVDLSKQDSLVERASSKLTLDDELYDILYAFGLVDTSVFDILKAKFFGCLMNEDGKSPKTLGKTSEKLRRVTDRVQRVCVGVWQLCSPFRCPSIPPPFIIKKRLVLVPTQISGIEVLPQGLRDNPLVLRRASVFHDLITVFRKNTKHFQPPSSSDFFPSDNFSPSASNVETDAFLGKSDKQRETDEDGNPLTRQALLERIRQKKEVIGKLRCHFGSVVSSYFTFLRWIVFVNVVITLIAVVFVVLPEALGDSVADESRQNRTRSRKQIPPSEKVHADEIAVVWHYDGYLRYSPLFYGYYSDDPFLGAKVRYAVPLAYFMVTIFIFAYSFFAILRKMAANARMSKLSGSKAEQYIFNWKLFTGWDYTIGNSDTASNTVMAVVIKLRESIADSRVEGHGKFRCLQFSLRVFANLVICAMLAFSIYCISFAVQKSQTAVEQEGNLFTKNQKIIIRERLCELILDEYLFYMFLNYLTLIFALFRQNGCSSKKTDYSQDYHFRFKRQQGGWNPNIVRPPPYASRTFENRHLVGFLPRTTQSYDLPSQRTTRSYTTPYTVAPQYGPFNVNNPNAILRNGTPIGEFEAQRVGPQLLPIFTPPPRTFPPHSSGRVGQQYGGPDFEKTKVYTKSTPLPRVRTKPPWKWSTTVSPSQDESQTQIVQPDPTQVSMRNDSQLGSSIDLSNDTIHMGQMASRKSNGDEIYNSDICWETIIGQEIVKLVTMDLIFTILSILVIDFLRGVWIKYCSSWWCWDIETTFPEYGEFKVAENVLHIINNQGMIWLGLFFAPLLPALNNIKLVILMYIRGWAVMTCNVPAREIFRASRSSNFYLLILLLWLLLCTLPVGYVIASTKPSKACGPFARYDYFYTVVTREIEKRVDQTFLNYIKHIASPGVVIPIILFLILIIYFLVSLVRGLREANTDLQQQLIHERTEEKKKIFELAGGGKKRMEKKENRKTAEYVPEVEQRRRETWRVYHEGEPDRILASDSSDESDLDDDDEWKQQSLITKPYGLEEDLLANQETVQVMAFHPSLGSLIEDRELEDEENTEQAKVHFSSSLPGTSLSQMQIDSSMDSISQISRNVIQVATPEEIRSLLRPLLEAHYGVSMTSTHPFPSEIHSSPTILTSRRSSKCSSFVSLYESAKEDLLHSKALTTTSTIYELPETQPEVHQKIRKEPIEKSDTVLLRTKRAPSVERQETNSSKNNKYITSDISPQFLPWPSFEEAKNIRERMKQKTPLPLKKLSKEDISPLAEVKVEEKAKLEYRPPVPIHRKYQTATGSEAENLNKSTDSSKRFRISVSPTKTVQSNQGNEVTRNLIHQASSGSIPTQSRQSDINQNPVVAASPRAPRVQFGEDDSPRLLE
ncbi:unnamed protein product [Caenorhabditis auriculariae]|uniref:TMC domain-containing protein n=1 Tax=Caenorhabditis auriculariae TaxID=2777116 RepID=A0A8S1H2Z8_9PELO|nr:unnamed protein product [Caenorhabditis auriculariae]